jgi:hypothetical protein
MGPMKLHLTDKTYYLKDGNHTAIKLESAVLDFPSRRKFQYLLEIGKHIENFVPSYFLPGIN